MANKILSIEISQGLTHVVEMDYKAKNAKVYNMFAFETPVDVIKDGIVRKNDTFTALFKAELESRKITTNKAVFVVNSPRIAVRDVVIPRVKENRIQAYIEANATEYFPIDTTLFHLVYKVTDKFQEEKRKKLRLSVYAVPNDITSAYYDMAQSLGLELTALDHVGNSVFEVIGSRMGSGTSAIAKIQETNTLILVVKDGKIDMQRIINYGVEDAIELVRDNPIFGENLTYADAIEVLSGKTVIRRTLDSSPTYVEEEDSSDAVRNARTRVTDSLRYLVAGIGRVLEYYLSRNPEEKFEEIALTGLGADFSGLSKLLSNELNQNVKVFHRANKIAVNRVIDGEVKFFNSYAACLGAGLNPMNLIRRTKTAKGEKAGLTISGERAYLIGSAVCVLGIIGAIALGAVSYLRLNAVKTDIDKTNAHIQEMREKGVEEVYNEYTAVCTENEQINVIYDSTRSRSSDLVYFINELEEKMPSDFLALSFNATRSGISISCECESKESAARIIMRLRKFDSVEIVSTNGLQDSDTLRNHDKGNGKVSFSVECIYKPIATSTESEGE
ncbi:MAG: hypothetical protein PUB11_01925 [Oscillospiraceae bacterium]|nr:hypothetical protein [Oscillospiraceae bacterium]